MEIAGAEEVRLKLFSTFNAKGPALLFAGWPNVNGVEEVGGVSNGFTGVGPVPNNIVPVSLLPFAPVSMRVGLSSIFMPSSGLDGGVSGRGGVLNVNGDDVGGTDVAAGVAGSEGFAPNVNIGPAEDAGG